MRKILITAAGTGTAFSYVTAIAKNFPELAIITADTNSANYTTAALFSKKHFEVASSVSEGYKENIIEIIGSEGIDFYLPLIDTEIDSAHDVYFLKEKLLANNKNFCRACLEKDKYHIWADELRIKTPLLLSKDQIKDFELIVLKKNGGFGSRTTKILNAKETTSSDLDKYMAYEYISGEEYTVDCFPLDSKVITTVRRRVEVKNGVSVKAEITKNDYLNNLAGKIVSHFNLTHPFCFQVIRTGQDFYLIDVNPRLGAGSAMSTITGRDYFSAHMALALGKDPSVFLLENYENCIITRQYANYLMKAF